MTGSLLRTLTAASAAACWIAFALTWIAGALYNSTGDSRLRVHRRPGSAGFIAAVAVVALAALAVIGLVPGAAWRAVTVRDVGVRLLAVIVLVGSTALALWARIALGRMWSLAPTIKERHELRTGGPYGVTRHPIYTGLLGMLLGTSLVAGLGRSLVILPAGLILLELKVRAEEALLLESFPAAYPPYRRRVPRLVPSLRRARRRASADDRGAPARDQ